MMMMMIKDVDFVIRYVYDGDDDDFGLMMMIIIIDMMMTKMLLIIIGWIHSSHVGHQSSHSHPLYTLVAYVLFLRDPYHQIHCSHGGQL